MSAVAAIREDAVLTAVRMDAPHARTISGTRKDPPETPTMPEPNPVSNVTGITVKRWTVRGSLEEVRVMVPARLCAGKSRFSLMGMSMSAPATASITAKIIFRENPLKRCEK